MPVLSQALLALVSSHLMSFSLFPAWHIALLLFIGLNLVDK
jgi:hypothetical protein